MYIFLEFLHIILNSAILLDMWREEGNSIWGIAAISQVLEGMKTITACEEYKALRFRKNRFMEKIETKKLWQLSII